MHDLVDAFAEIKTKWVTREKREQRNRCKNLYLKKITNAEFQNVLSMLFSLKNDKSVAALTDKRKNVDILLFIPCYSP